MLWTRLIVLCPGKYTPHRSLRISPRSSPMGTFRAEKLDCVISIWISAAESQTFLLAKRPRRRRARRNGCFRRLTTPWISRYIERCQTEETEALNTFQYNLIPDCYSSKRSITASLRTGGINKKVSPGTRIPPVTQDRSRRPYVIWEKWSQLLDLTSYVSI